MNLGVGGLRWMEEKIVRAETVKEQRGIMIVNVLSKWI